MDKQTLRNATIGKPKNFKKKIVEIDGNKFEVRQPTIGQRGEIRNRSMKLNMADGSGAMDFDMFAFMICAVMELTYVPNTDEKVFSEEDYESLIQMPAGGWFDELTKEASALCNVSDDKEVKKPLEKTVSE